MKYLDLFNEIQLSRDYYEDSKTGANWRYHIDDENRRIYIEVQETKTKKDWFYNFLIFRKKINCAGNKKIIVPLGFYLQARPIINDVFNRLCFNYHYDCYEWFFAGWSLGGATAAIAGFVLAPIINKKANLIMYGTPAFCARKKDVKTLCEGFMSVRNFVYTNDWIFHLIPGWHRPECENVQPDKATETLDQRHRVYGHCTYFTSEF